MARRPVALALAGFLACGCAQAGEQDKTSAPSPGVKLEGAKLTETDGRDTVWELFAERVDYRTEAKIAELTGVKTRFYDDGAIASTGTAPRAVFHLDDRRLELLGGISVVAEATATGFEAERVVWLPDVGKLSARGHVRFRRGPNTLSAPALTADRALSRVTLTGGVHGQAALTGTPLWPEPSKSTRSPQRP